MRARDLVASLACLLVMGISAGPAFATARIARRQLVVVVLANHNIRSKPDGRTVWVLKARRPITGARTVLPVLRRTLDSSGNFWLQVRLPGRVTGGGKPPPTGWIRASRTELQETPWHIVVDLAARRLVVYKYGRVVRRFRAVVGKPSTPTPTGQYFVEEDVTLSKGQPGGPFALATSDRSNVLKTFDGGPGQIAIHGLEKLGGTPGTAASHGCVRLANGNITWLASQIGAGTPVTIRQRLVSRRPGSGEAGAGAGRPAARRG
jgi:lipoprotein-anchoring transpeptidase ErfK/SrfK